MKEINLDIYCVTNKRVEHLEGTPLKLVCVGKENLPDFYLRCNKDDNIYHKEQYYSELTFHYWFWKNRLDNEKDKWLGFCQKRRIWTEKEIISNKIKKNDVEKNMLKNSKKEWKNYEAIICKPINVFPVKKMKLIKRGFRSIIKDPSILFDVSKQSVLLHFDMHHGYGNLEKAIHCMNDKDKNDFYNYVKKSTKFNPHIMYISKPEILKKWFSDLFNWLERCETIFDKNMLIDYDTGRLFAYLAERYASFWFKKYTKFYEQPWAIVE